MEKIIVEVSGGNVTNVLGIPEGIQVVIKDYDNEESGDAIYPHVPGLESKQGFCIIDPCYVLSDDFYREMLKALGSSRSSFYKGVFIFATLDGDLAEPAVIYDGKWFNACESIDSGLCAIIPMDLVSISQGLKKGVLFAGKKLTNFSFRDHMIIAIDEYGKELHITDAHSI